MNPPFAVAGSAHRLKNQRVASLVGCTVMASRDPDLVLRLAVHLNVARQLALQPRQTTSRFARGDFKERPWKGNNRLTFRSTPNAIEARYLVSEPIRRSWEFSFKPTLTAEELFDWLISRQ